MKILVTGASGFVGSALVDQLLLEQHDIRLLLRRHSSKNNLPFQELREGKPSLEVVEGDLRDYAALLKAVEGMDIIFHVAGKITAASRQDFFAANADGTENLVKAALEKSPNLRRFIYVSSLAAAGPAKKNQPRMENENPEPISIYGESKLGGELVLKKYANVLPSVIVRPPVVYGPRDRGMFPFFQIVARGLRPSLLKKDKDPGGYSFIHVDDLVQALVQLAFSSEKIPPAEVFFAAGDGEFTWDTTMQFMADAFSKKGIQIPIPIAVLKAVAPILETVAKIIGKQAPLNRDKVKELSVSYWTCSNKKLKDTIGFKPNWSLREGFRETANWYRERSWL